MKTENTIYYGMGKEYLPKWGIREALREIFQNFIDYGAYREGYVEPEAAEIVSVRISNDWKPESLDFLRIGRTQKNTANAIGKHGEGIKMAFLILARLGYSSKIVTDKYFIEPSFYTDKEVGECFCMKYKEHNLPGQDFAIEFDLPKGEYRSFRDNVIKEADVLFSSEYGDVVDKEKGNIYSGGLFVVKLDTISKAYNIKPEYLPLDRDRSVPRSFDVNWATSKILSHYEKWSAKDLSYSDTSYIDKIPDGIKKEFEPVLVRGKVEFITKDAQGNQTVVSGHIKEVLKKDSFFEKTIKKLKVYIAKKLGLYEMLVEFKEKHLAFCDEDALQDFDMILEKVADAKTEKKEKEVLV